MKESYLGYWLILFGVFVVVIMLLIGNVTKNTTEDSYAIKQISDAALIDAIDFGYYREYGELKINKEKFMEAFLRRFADSITGASNYKVLFTGIYEAPPKVSVEVSSKTDKYIIGSDATELDMVNRINSILELGDGVAQHGNGHSSSSAPTTPSEPTTPPGSEGEGEVTCEDMPTDFDESWVDNPLPGFSLVQGSSNYSRIYADYSFKKYTNKKVVSSDTPFEIYGVKKDVSGKNDAFFIKNGSDCGWVNATYMAVSMVDFLPSGGKWKIKYNILNASGNQYQIGGKNRDVSTGNAHKIKGNNFKDTDGGGNFTGQKLYSADYTNYVPLAWPMAQRIRWVLSNGINSSGYTLEINDAYRAFKVSRVANYFYRQNVLETNSPLSKYKSIVNVDGFNPRFFLAPNISSHNTGCAVDATLSGYEDEMPTVMHELSANARRDTKQGSSILANSVKKSPANDLQKFMTKSGSGLVGLTSEWWHFELKNGCRQEITNEYTSSGGTPVESKVSNLFVSSYVNQKYNKHCKGNIDNCGLPY